MRMRLIDADALLEDGIRVGYGINDNGLLMVPLRDVHKSIKNAPTVDAVAVVHGRWEIDRHWCYECSVCRKGYVGMPKTTYCPNCGAKMDGDGDG